MLLFLLVPIFRRAIFSSDLITVPFIFHLSYFLGVGLLFLACIYLVVLFLARVDSRLLVPVSSYEMSQTKQMEVFQCDKWRLFEACLIKKTLGHPLLVYLMVG
jgi:hypothetical protein